jgi:preprotein translocase subunit SecF
METSPTGKALFTLSPALGVAFAVTTVASGITLPALAAAGYPIPAWVGIVVAGLNSVFVAVALLGAGARRKKTKPKDTP